MEIAYSPSFVRKYKNFPDSLKQEIKEKIVLFQDEVNHRQLRVHKLSGSLKDQYSFSVNYKVRVVFVYSDETPRRAILLAVGDHDIYNE
jgi:mRNA-degrading endonuclease YafQ of YafQ-DinJ toxin-antitoxin module